MYSIEEELLLKQLEIIANCSRNHQVSFFSESSVNGSIYKE